MPSLAELLKDALPKQAWRIGKVTYLNGDGATAQVLLPEGGTIRVRGQSVPVGSNAFILGDVIQGPAPDGNVVEIEI